MMASRNQSPGHDPGRARGATVRVETDAGIYVGRIEVPETKKRVSGVFSDERQFITLTEVSVNDSARTEPFVAIDKQHIRTIRVLHELRSS